MSTVFTTTASPVFQYPHHRKIDINYVNNHLWMVGKSSAGDYVFYRSIDGGLNWTLRSTLTRANIQEWSSIFIDNSGHLHWAYRTNESSEDRIYYRRLKLSTEVWGAELLVSAVANGGTAGSIYQGMCLTSVAAGSYHYIPICVGKIVPSTSNGIIIFGVTVNISTLAQNVNNGIIHTKREWQDLLGSPGAIRPSCEYQHFDGKAASVPHLWVTWGRTKIKCVKLAWTYPYWTGPTTAATVTSNPLTAQDGMNSYWDGTRFCIAVSNPDDTDTVKVHQRNATNTSGLTAFVTGAHPTGVVRFVAMTYLHTNKNIRIYAVGTSTDVLYQNDLNRATGLWSGWTSVTGTAILSGNNFGVRSGTWKNSIYSVITVHSGAPNTVAHNPGTFPSVPSPATWNAATGVNGSAFDTAVAKVLDWDFKDPDPGDVQSAFALSRQIGAGALNYWRVSDSTWQVSEVKNVTATSVINPTSWGADGDAAHTYKVKTWDAADSASIYSEGFIVIPAVKSNPTLTAPSVDQVTTAPQVTISWTVGEQTAYRVTLVPNPNPDGILPYDSGWQQSTDLTHVPSLTLLDGSAWTLSLQTKENEGLASNLLTRNFTVDYTDPGTPAYVITPQPTLGVNRVVITNPASGLATFVAAGASATGNNAPVVPGLPAGMIADDAMIMKAWIRNSGTGTVNTPTDWTPILAFGNVAIFGRKYVVGDAAPTVSFAGGVANADTGAQIAAWRRLSIRASNTATVLNGVVQDVAYPALTVALNNQVIIAVGWKQDDWTSAALAGFAGAVEIAEVISTAGDDAASVWDYAIQTTAANITGASFVITGGVTAISRGITMAFDPKPALATQDLYRRVVGDTSDGLRIAAGLLSNATYDDYTAISGVDYQYRVKALGVTGTEVFGAWTS